jgi:DDE superfamily endonuclease
MKKGNRKILLFLDNAPCHVLTQDFSNIKLAFFPPNTTSKCQPLDQGVIRSFKCHCRQKLIKHIIAQCSVAQTVDQISITALDAVKWIDSSWKTVTELTIQNGFRAAGFVNSFTASSLSTIDTDVIAEADSESDKSDDGLQQLDSLLTHIHIGGQQLTAAEFIDIDSSIPAFNEWDDDEHLKGLIEVLQEEDNEEEEILLAENPLNLSEVLEMVAKLHLFASTQQPQLHSVVSDLQSQLTDIYIDSKSVKQSSIKDYFSSC